MLFSALCSFEAAIAGGCFYKVNVMEQATERWQDVVGYEGLYLVSDYGRVRSVDRTVDGSRWQMRIKGRIMRPGLMRGYHQVGLHQNAMKNTFLIHRLVAAAFFGPCPDGKEVNHIDGNKLNNDLVNLEYVTHSENILHAYQMGLKKVICGANHCRAKLTDKDVLEIRATYEAGGVTHRKLAKKYGVGHVQIFNIIHRRRWAHSVDEMEECLMAEVAAK